MTTNSVPSNLQLPAVLGIATSSALASSILSFSLYTVPTILLPSPSSSSAKPGTALSHLPHQWYHQFNLGKLTMPPVSIVAGGLYTYLAISLRHSDTTRARLFGTAAVLTMAIIPYTMTAMRNVNRSLFAKVEEVNASSNSAEQVKEGAATGLETSKGQKTEDLIRMWAMFNLVRAMLPVAGTVVGITGFLGY